MKIKPKSPKVFPIYLFSLKWVQDIKRDEISGYIPKQEDDMPLGRTRNSTSWYQMFHSKQTNEKLQKIIDNYWKSLIKQDKYKTAELSESEYKYIESETWVLQWFSHTTFDVGQSDEEALKSFKEFVDRKQQLIEKDETVYCLMGAEDTFRWRSGSEEYHEIPCRCKHCKKQGVLIIAH